MRSIIISIAAASLAACTAPFGEKDAPLPTPEHWSFSAAAADLRAVSCPDGIRFTRPEPLSIEVAAVDKGPVSAYADRLAGVRFAGAWALQSAHPSFGGLSGLAVQPSGSLLSITDAGAFVHIGIDPETGEPDGLGAMAFMPDLSGKFLSGKRLADSEGLDMREGLALVSFERDHRVAAFDMEGCGAAARAAPVAALSDRVDGRKIGSNRGAEALFLEGDTLHVGFEHRIDGYAVVGRVNTDDSVQIQERRLPQSSYLLTGADHDAETGLFAYVYRWYLPAIGTRIIVEVEGPDLQRQFTIAAPMPVDNFEGIAIGQNPAGNSRIWLISDNNFNPVDQRTLLFAFDL